MSRDRESLLQQLEVAKQRVSAGELKLVHQKLIIDSLRATQGDPDSAREKLRSLEVEQDACIAEIDRILDELDRIRP